MTHFLFRSATVLVVVFGVLIHVNTSAHGHAETPDAESTGDWTLVECQRDLQSILEENNNLKKEIEDLRAALDNQRESEEDEEAESNESHSRSRGLRGKRGTSGCEGGTVSQWACGSQCIFKLKGLCGLSLRAMCHC